MNNNRHAYLAPRRRGSRQLWVCWLAATSVAAAQQPAAHRDTAGPQARQAWLQELAEPFCYFLVPSDVLGFKDCPEGTQVTWDGAFNTGFGEFDLHAGSPLQPVRKRVKTLYKGYLPILEYAFDRDGAHYAVQAFAAPLELDPRQDLINFVRVTVSNPGPERVRAGIKAVFTDLHGQGRHRLSCQTWYRDQFMDAATFAAAPVASTADGLAWRGQHVVFTYPPGGTAEATPQDPVVAYEFELAPRQARALTFKVPYVPVFRDHEALIQSMAQADYAAYFTKVVDFWEQILQSGLSIEVPEEKVVHTARTSLIYDLIARDIAAENESYIQKVNEFQYDNFYPRDSAYIVRTYDLMGLHGIAEETLDYFIMYGDDGRACGLRRMMPDDWGQSLWSVGAHYRSTQDAAYLQRVYPAIPAHIAAFEQACATDPLGLWPVAGPYDNEALNGHYTGHSFWALLGLREAVHLARAAGRTEDMRTFQQIHDGYRQRFLERLRWVSEQAEGYIPPGLDDPRAGYDWANASGGVYPFGVLDADDPMVTATVNMVRQYKYREGIMTYGPNAWVLKEKSRRNQPADPGWLHHYETFYVVQTLLARGEQKKVIEDFYAILAHTGSTHSGFEFSIRPWSDRDPGGNRPPHGWFAARYNALLRNMLLREEGPALHVASALSPAWLQPGSQIRVRNGATLFGRVSMAIDSHDSGARVTLQPQWREPPERVLFHIPWFVTVTDARVDGRPVTSDQRSIALPPSARQLDITWRQTEQPELDYRSAVKLLLTKYHFRPLDADYAFLFPTPRPPRLTYPHGMFLEAVELDLKPIENRGTIHYTLDGSVPDPAAAAFSGPITLTETTTIRAVTVWPDGQVSPPLEVTLSKVQPRAADRPGPLTAGLQAYYHEGTWDRLPAFDGLPPVRTAMVPHFDLERLGHRADNFGVRFSGYVDLPADGVYTFYIASDDGSRLSIGSSLVVDNDGLHSLKEESGSIALARGKHPITVTFFERGGAERLDVSYSGPGIPRQPIPAQCLHTERQE